MANHPDYFDLPTLTPLPMGDARSVQHIYMTGAGLEILDVASSTMTTSGTTSPSRLNNGPTELKNGLFPSILITGRHITPADEDYVLDSGATACVVENSGVLHDFVPNVTPVKGVGGSTESTGRGSLRLSLLADDARPIELLFRGTLCVPGAPRLLSVTRIVDGGAAFTVPSPERALLSIGDAVISAPRTKGLYLLRATTILPPSTMENPEDAARATHGDHAFSSAHMHGYSEQRPFDGTIEQLHSTLGHSSAAVLNRQLRDGLLDWISTRLQRVLRTTTRFQCSSCSRLPVVHSLNPVVNLSNYDFTAIHLALALRHTPRDANAR